MKNNRYIAIMAGGVGSRFWPSSTENMPKQFLDILGLGKSLLRMTYERCLGLVDSDHVLVVTNQRYKDLVQTHIPELPEENILCEPSRNNTAPCIAYTALHLKAINRDSLFAVLPSDHIILDNNAFETNLSKAFDFAEKEEAIVTLGITPSRPDTGFGYIEYDRNEVNASNGPIKVNSFREKPSRELAQDYLEQGNYLWNAGIFIWHTNTLLKAFGSFESQILDVLMQNESMFGSSKEQEYINEVYPNTKSISVDYAILERASNVYTIPSDIGWSDLGTWNSLYSYAEKDSNENVIQTDKAYLDGTSNCIIRSASGKQIVIKGMKDYIIVDEPHALLIYPISDEQEIKNVVQKLD